MQIKHYHLETVDSTNNWAKSRVAEFNKRELTYISADFQTAGRGRFKRAWISPPNQNLLATYVIWLGQFDFNLPQVLALAVTDLLKERGFVAEIKWPNDLLIKKKKIAGILAETVEEEEGRWMILGIGLNLNMTEEMLALIDRPATSLLNESGVRFNPDDIGRLLAAYLEKSLAHYHGFGPFHDRFQERLIHRPGDPLTIGQDHGVFKSFNPDGSITLTLDTGVDKTFISGEITEE